MGDECARRGKRAHRVVPRVSGVAFAEAIVRRISVQLFFIVTNAIMMVINIQRGAAIWAAVSAFSLGWCAAFLIAQEMER